MVRTSDTNLLRQKQVTNKIASGIRDIRIQIVLKRYLFLQECSQSIHSPAAGGVRPRAEVDQLLIVFYSKAISYSPH